MSDVILVLNAGSSSLKFRVFGFEKELPLLGQGVIEEIGSTNPMCKINKEPYELPKTARFNHADALQTVLKWLDETFKDSTLRVVGHRIVHGGDLFAEATLLDQDKVNQLRELTPLAPLHQPHNLGPVEFFFKNMPHIPQVGCFDTAFHAKKPDLFKAFAIPKKFREEHGMKRYGFHGLSYQWIAEQIKEHYPEYADKKVIVAHLGNGATITALKDLQCVDTSIGMSVIDGLPMGTRCGAIDPGAVLHMMRQLGLSLDEVDHILTKESGLLGLSGVSNDMRQIEEAGTADAEFALEYYTLKVSQFIAQLAVSIGGIDLLVFTAGIGENADNIRQGVMERLKFLGDFDMKVIPTNEEAMIAKNAMESLH